MQSIPEQLPNPSAARAALLTSLIKYGIVGVSNTAIGMGVVYAGWKWAGLGDLWSNVIGYVIGFLWSYTANRLWTFRDQGVPAKAAGSLPRFALVCAVAYAANLAVLFGCRGAGVGGFWPHISGAVVYTCIGFVGSRFFAFAAVPPRVAVAVDPSR